MATAALVVAGTGGAWFGRWPLVEALIEWRFAEVAWLRPDELASWMAEGRRFTLLDVREPAEFEVSHLPGARRVAPDAPVEALVAGLPADAPVVLYCSVGWRSAALAARLQAARSGRPVYNLRGAIFGWANAGRPVYRAHRPVGRVHPFSGVWGLWLAEARRAPIP